MLNHKTHSRFPTYDGHGRELGSLTLREAADLAESDTPGAEFDPETRTISIDPGEGPMESRRATCEHCGIEGIHVDTTTGEIISGGCVVAIIAGPLLMADGGSLCCDECGG